MVVIRSSATTHKSGRSHEMWKAEERHHQSKFKDYLLGNKLKKRINKKLGEENRGTCPMWSMNERTYLTQLRRNGPQEGESLEVPNSFSNSETNTSRPKDSEKTTILSQYWKNTRPHSRCLVWFPSRVWARHWRMLYPVHPVGSIGIGWPFERVWSIFSRRRN